MPDLAHLDSLRGEIIELDRLHHEALIGLGVARLEMSGWSPDVSEIERLVDRYPLDERSWRLLIPGHYRSGRQAESLVAFQRASEILSTELGLEPGPELRRIEEHVLTHDSALEPPLLSVVDLPSFTTPFRGRTETVRQLEEAVPGQRLITLVGMGGVGKTRLAVEAGNLAADRFVDGVCFVSLESLEDPSLVPLAVRDAVSNGPRPSTRSPAEVIGNRNMLLVIDNCEHLIDAVGDTVVDLLRSCSALSILATSRTPLGVNGEMTWTVPPLELPDRRSPPPDIAQTESVAFFVEAAQRVRRDFALDSGNAAVIADICRHLAGLPLAIELTAALSDVLTPHDIHELTTDSEHTPTRDERGRPSRHRSLDDTVEWSLRLLHASDRHVFERMAVFAGSVDQEAIAAVCHDKDRGCLVDSLQRLSNSSLITVDVSGKRAAYGQLPPIRQVAGQRVPVSERAELQSTHTGYFIDLATSGLGRGGAGQLAWFERIDAVIDEVRIALDRV